MRDRYRLDRELGHGGMATVYLAHDLKHDRKVALKVLRPELAAVLGTERFLREIRLTAGLDHPHIVPVLDSGEIAGLLWYTMPFVEGETLRHRLQREGQLPLGEALALVREVADGLAYAHARGLVHRDVKPENILLADGHARLADFGIARASAGGECLTETGLALGTVAYMSPEQASGESVDARTDVYALGCVLYELLAGEPPYTGPTAQAIVGKRLSAPIPSVRHVRPDIPEAVDRVLHRALGRRPADRPSDAGALLAELRSPAASSSRHVRALRWMGVATLVAVLLMVAASLRHRAAPTTPMGRGAPALAVLPLVNIGSDTADKYFADGLTDELTSALSRVPGVLVISRTSAFAVRERRDLDVREIGQRLGAATLLEGTVRRGAGRVRVTLTLTDAERGTARWSHQYERELGDMFDMQDQIVQAVAIEVGSELKPLASRRSIDPRAYDLYLRGLGASHSFSEVELRQALRDFSEALALDSTLAAAWTGTAFVWNILADDFVPPRLALPEIRAGAEHALALDPTLADAHAALASGLFYYEWDFHGAEAELRRALTIDPNNANALYLMGGLLTTTGRGDSSSAYYERAHLIDPLSTAVLVEWASALSQLRQSTRAVEVCDPTGFTGSAAIVIAICRAQALSRAGYSNKALAILDSLRSPELIRGSRARVVALVGLGRLVEARALASHLEGEARHRYMRADILAQIFAVLGDRDRAFRWLQRAVEDRNGGLTTLALSPNWDGLRGDARYPAVLRRVGLAEWFPNGQ